MQTDRMRDIMKEINRCAARLAFEHRRQNSHMVIYDEMLELHDEMMECLGRADEECELCGDEWAAQCRECEENGGRVREDGDLGDGTCILPPTGGD